ncbi:hypothetical protein OE810_02365 [Rhodobacteraceae bacterium XHP0102]|nr:hypothetical protein [Rhodobacteraceae bacterium XHP0102]
MSNDAVPVLSIIVRRFHSDFKDDILQSLTELQRAAANQTGYLGHHNSLSEDDQYCELVNIFSFNSRGNLQEWENSDVRNSCLANLDQHPQTTTKHSQFNELAQILHPKTQIKKIEIVVILIFLDTRLERTLRLLCQFFVSRNLPPRMEVDFVDFTQRCAHKLYLSSFEQ